MECLPPLPYLEMVMILSRELAGFLERWDLVTCGSHLRNMTAPDTLDTGQLMG